MFKYKDLLSKRIYIYSSAFKERKIFGLLLFCGIIGLCWLLFLGQIRLVLLSLISLFLWAPLYRILLFPSKWLMPILLKDIIFKKKWLVVGLGFIFALYNNFILTTWVYSVYFVIKSLSNQIFITPLIIAGYAVCLGAVYLIPTKQELSSEPGLPIDFVYSQSLFFLILFLWISDINPLFWIIFTIISFSLLNVLEEIMLSIKLSKKNKYIDGDFENLG